MLAAVLDSKHRPVMARLMGLGVMLILIGIGIAALPWQISGLIVLALLAIAAILVLFLRPEWAIWLTLGLVFFGNRTEIPALYFWGRYLPTAGVGIFIVAVGARWLSAGHIRLKGRTPIVWLTLFVLLLLISAAYNLASPRDVLLSLLTYLRYPLFFLVLININLKPDFYHRMIAAFVALSLAQVPITLIQFALGLKGDWLGGTLGANQMLIAVTLISQCALLAHWLATGERSSTHLLAILALIVPGLLGDVQVGLVFLPLLAVYIAARHYGVRRFLRTIVLTILLVLCGLGLVLVMALFVPTVQEFLSVIPQYTFQSDDPARFAGGASLGRLTIFSFSLPLLAEDPLRLFWGFGPEAAQGGLLSATFGEGGTAEISQMGIVCEKLVALGTLCREPQMFKNLMEFGFLGTFLYMALLFWLWRYGASLLRKAQSAEARSLVLFFEGVSVLYVLLGVWYLSIWRLDSYSFPFWLLGAAMFAEKRAMVAEHQNYYLKM